MRKSMKTFNGFSVVVGMLGCWNRVELFSKNSSSNYQSSFFCFCRITHSSFSIFVSSKLLNINFDSLCKHVRVILLMKYFAEFWQRPFFVCLFVEVPPQRPTPSTNLRSVSWFWCCCCCVSLNNIYKQQQ